MIDAGRIVRALSNRGREVEVVHLPITESTNDDAKRAAARGTRPPALFLADEQTRGRGRGGSTWVSRPAENLLMSLLVAPRVAPAEASRLTLAAGAAVADVIEVLLPGRVAIKWPNDVFVDDRKLAGLLVEAQTRGDGLASVVIGVGVNVHTRAFPPELADIATSLAAAGVMSVDRSDLAVSLVSGLLDAMYTFEERGLDPFLEGLRRRDLLRGERIAVDEVSGVASGIDDRGRLVVLRDDGTETAVSSGHMVREARASRA